MHLVSSHYERCLDDIGDAIAEIKAQLLPESLTRLISCFFRAELSKMEHSSRSS